MLPSSWSVCISTSWWRRACWDLQPEQERFILISPRKFCRFSQSPQLVHDQFGKVFALVFILFVPSCSPYSEPLDLPPVDHSDPKLGLRGYTLHFVLHNTGTEIMSGNFRQLSCSTGQIHHGLMEMRVINKTDLSQHRSLSGNVKLPWKSEALEGSVEFLNEAAANHLNDDLASIEAYKKKREESERAHA